MFFCIVLLLSISVVHGKTSGTTTSSYGYTTTPTSYVSSGSYISGRSHGNTYYRSGGSGCTSSQCGQTTCGATEEIESLCTFTDGSCASHGCQAVVTEEACYQAAIAAGANIASTTPTPWGATTTQSSCTQLNACTYNSATNQMSYCGATYSSNCYVGTPCVCWCVVQDIWSSEDQTGMIVGIIFGVLFGICFIVAIAKYFCCDSSKGTHHVASESTWDDKEYNPYENNYNNNNQWGSAQNEGATTGATWGETNYSQQQPSAINTGYNVSYDQPPAQSYGQPPAQTYSSGSSYNNDGNTGTDDAAY